MGIFILNCLVMAKIAKKTPHRESIIDQVAQESVPVKTDEAAPATSDTPSTPDTPATPDKPKPATPAAPPAPKQPAGTAQKQ
jgi:hypothetical protein